MRDCAWQTGKRDDGLLESCGFERLVSTVIALCRDIAPAA